MKEILVKYHADIDHIERISVGDWIDLRAAEDTWIPKGQMRMIPLGVSMKLPKGYEAHVVPRSSTYYRYGVMLANSFGVIDNSYSGDYDIWHFPAVCIDPKEFRNGEMGSFIAKNTRICQFRIESRQPDDIMFTEVDHLDGVNRGGFGYTGTK